MKANYRIARGTETLNPETGRWEAINLDEYDLVIETGNQSRGANCYTIIKNTTGLTADEIADICDPNNFGYERYGNLYRIYTD